MKLDSLALGDIPIRIDPSVPEGKIYLINTANIRWTYDDDILTRHLEIRDSKNSNQWNRILTIKTRIKITNET